MSREAAVAISFGLSVTDDDQFQRHLLRIQNKCSVPSKLSMVEPALRRRLTLYHGFKRGPRPSRGRLRTSQRVGKDAFPAAKRAIEFVSTEGTFFGEQTNFATVVFPRVLR